VEPRFLAQAPTGTDLVSLAYLHSWGAVLYDKTLPAENVDGTTHTFVAGYARFFSLFGVTARVDGALPFGTGDWTGLAAGVDTSRTATGLGDPFARLAVFFVGAPAQSAGEFREHSHDDTVVGAAIRVRAPLGQYDSSKLINLGSNRWMFSPRLGVAQPLGRFVLEGYASGWFFTDNTEFFGMNTVSQHPLLAIQLHVTYVIRRAFWIALSTRQSFGGATSVNGAEAANPQTSNRVGLTLALPVSTRGRIRVAATTGLSTSVGNDYNTVAAAWSWFF